MKYKIHTNLSSPKKGKKGGLTITIPDDNYIIETANEMLVIKNSALKVVLAIPVNSLSYIESC